MADPQTERGGDAILARARKTLEGATITLAIVAAVFSHGRLPHVGWAVAAAFGVMALWLSVEIAIAVGQRCGLIGTKLLSPHADSPRDVEPIVARREPACVVRDVGEAAPSGRVAAAGGGRIRTIHIPLRGSVSFRIEGPKDTRC